MFPLCVCRLPWRAILLAQSWSSPVIMNPSYSSARCEGQSHADNLMDDWLFLSSESAGPQVLEVSRDDQEAEERSRLRSKLVSAWNSVRYGQFYLPYM